MSQLSKKIKVAVDGMGGDYAPEEVVKGAILAAEKDDVEIMLVGSTDVLKGELTKCGFSNKLPIHLVQADEVIQEGESPALAVRRKPDCSISVAAKLVRDGEADALVGAGSSGAAAVSAIQFIGMVEGIERPAIAGTLGTFAHNTVLLDLGANVDCKPHQFLAFAIVGSVFARKLLNVAEPTIALLSTGSEEGKGNEAVREAYHLLKNSGLNFIGNIEGGDMLSGKANVVICDGFVGNVLLKFYEGIGDRALEWLKQRFKKYPPLRSAVTFLFNRFFPVTKLSYETEEEGGGVLWGIDGVVRLAHGSSKAPQIAHAILSAKNVVTADVVGCLRSELAKFKKEGKL